MFHPMMSLLPLVLLLFNSAAALPSLNNETTICAGGACDGDNFAHMKYERRVPSQPGYQWNDAGGYCGSWSVQRAALAKGAWISQQQGGDSIDMILNQNYHLIDHSHLNYDTGQEPHLTRRWP